MQMDPTPASGVPLSLAGRTAHHRRLRGIGAATVRLFRQAGARVASAIAPPQPRLRPFLPNAEAPTSASPSNRNSPPRKMAKPSSITPSMFLAILTSSSLTTVSGRPSPPAPAPMTAAQWHRTIATNVDSVFGPSTPRPPTCSPALAVPPVPNRQAASCPARPRPHRPHCLRRRSARRSWPRRLHHQGRDHRADQILSSELAPHLRQLRCPRLDSHRDDRLRLRPPRRRSPHQPHHPRRPSCTSPKSPAPSSSSALRSPALSPVRSSTSTAAPSCDPTRVAGKDPAPAFPPRHSQAAVEHHRRLTEVSIRVQ